MSTASSKSGSSLKHGIPPPSLRWQSWPLSREPVVAVFVTAGLLLAWIVVQSITGQTHLAFLTTLAVAISVWRFLIPVSFQLSPKGVDQRFLGRQKRIPWKSISRYEVCPGGVLLLPHGDRCAMQIFKGLYIAWEGRREEILNQMQYYLGEPSAK